LKVLEGGNDSRLDADEKTKAMLEGSLAMLEQQMTPRLHRLKNQEGEVLQVVGGPFEANVVQGQGDFLKHELLLCRNRSFSVALGR
jgi:hypothetical protein